MGRVLKSRKELKREDYLMMRKDEGWGKVSGDKRTGSRGHGGKENVYLKRILHNQSSRAYIA